MQVLHICWPSGLHRIVDLNVDTIHLESVLHCVVHVLRMCPHRDDLHITMYIEFWSVLWTECGYNAFGICVNIVLCMCSECVLNIMIFI